MLAKKALAGTAGAPKEYVEDVFSTYLYTGTGATNTISNSIDLSTKGGLVWIKRRDSAGYEHYIFDTERGVQKYVGSDSTSGEQTNVNTLTSFNNNGFTVGTSSGVNISSGTYASWTFRKAKKFFDVVTYTGNGSTGRNISHNLGSTPGCIIIKSRTGSDAWIVYHRGADNKYGQLAATNAFATDNGTFWGNGSTFTAPTSTVFTVSDHSAVNGNGATYVAYLFAHDAGGFGDAGSDNIITCGSLTTDGSGEATVTLGYEPQWLLLKPSSTTGNWLMVDTMRGWNVNATGNIQRLRANLSDAEDLGGQLNPTSTGFKTSQSGALAASHTYIYIAIRRGPMKTPTSGTDVFAPIYANQSAGTKNTTNFPVDAMIIRSPSGGENNHLVSRLTGVSTDSTDSGSYLYTQSTAAEGSGGITRGWDNTGFRATSGYAGYNVIYLPFRRAPGFFDVVCYTGDNAFNRAIPHNLAAIPELVITKVRSTTANWAVYSAATGLGNPMALNTTAASSANPYVWGTTAPTSTNFYIGDDTRTNGGGYTYVSYLFASVSGVSKVGSYTGNGSSVTVTTNFQPRFIMVKRTDSTGDWIVGNSARGLVAGDDPYIELNTTDAEVTNDDWVDITSTSFTVNQTATSNANVNTGTYIYLAIA